MLTPSQAERQFSDIYVVSFILNRRAVDKAMKRARSVYLAEEIRRRLTP
jgi:hypothetical protein